MHWLIYSTAPDGHLSGLRIIESNVKPRAPTINGGFKSAQEALVLMSEYLVVKPDGFVHMDEANLERSVTFADRVRHAYLVQPALAWLVALSLTIGLMSMVLTVFHIIGV